MSFHVGFDKVSGKIFVQQNTFLHFNDFENIENVEKIITNESSITNIYGNKGNSLNKGRFFRRKKRRVIRLTEVYSETGTYVFSFINEIIEFPVPNTGIYRIEAWGARGGSESNTTGPLGAYSRSFFSLKENDIVRVLVGEKGWSGRSDYIYCGGGGGGTFIAKGSTPLCVAGGGGSEAATKQTYTHSYACGQATQYSADIGQGQPAVKKGGYNSCGDASGGGGWEEDGKDGTSWGKGGNSFLNGGLRQTAKTGGAYGYGGFGGGGSRSGFCGYGSGGGGYTGGSSAGSDRNKQGAGGGSYFEGNYSNKVSFAISGCDPNIPANPDPNGNGYAIIQLLKSTADPLRNKNKCLCYKAHAFWTFY